MNQNFAAIILGGTGQVGGAAVEELLAIPECREVVMVTRKPIAPRSRVRNVVLDTGTADFADRTAALAREILSQGAVSAVSCAGVGRVPHSFAPLANEWALHPALLVKLLYRTGFDFRCPLLVIHPHRSHFTIKSMRGSCSMPSVLDAPLNRVSPDCDACSATFRSVCARSRR